jgi:hypothetical protein
VKNRAAVCCLILSIFFVGPRFALLLVWIFGNRVELAFDSWLWPLLGLLFLPWTTLGYVLAWQPGGVSGFWDVVLIGFGVLLDLLTYSARAAGKRSGAWS